MNGTEQKERQTAIAGLKAEVRTLMETYATEWDQTVGEINERITQLKAETTDALAKALEADLVVARALDANKENFAAQLAGVRDEFAGLLDTEAEARRQADSAVAVPVTDILFRGFWGRLKWLLTGK